MRTQFSADSLLIILPLAPSTSAWRPRGRGTSATQPSRTAWKEGGGGGEGAAAAPVAEGDDETPGGVGNIGLRIAPRERMTLNAAVGSARTTTAFQTPWTSGWSEDEDEDEDDVPPATGGTDGDAPATSPTGMCILAGGTGKFELLGRLLLLVDKDKDRRRSSLDACSARVRRAAIVVPRLPSTAPTPSEGTYT